MAFRLTDTQAKVVALVEQQLAQKPTPQLKFFFRKLRAAALPKIPNRRRNQTPNQYALEQTRWQRVAALAADSHTAAAVLLQNEYALMEKVEAEQNVSQMTDEQQHAALTEQLATAPASVHWEVHQRILALHPEWAEADNEPGGELIPIKGGKR
jgi:hypothetical protein